MANGRLFNTSTNDQIIFGQEMVTMLSVTLIAVILHWTMTSFKKDYSLTASRSMRIPCLLSMILFLIMNIVGMIGWNNVFIPITSITCKIIYPFCLYCYNFGKISMYYLFTFRIELIFQHTWYQVSTLWLNVYRILCGILPTVFWSIWIYLSWDDIKPHETESADPQYKYCFPQHFKYNNVYLSEHISFCIAMTDLLFSGIPLFLFIFKYYQVTAAYRKAKIPTNFNINDSANTDLYETLNSELPGFEMKHISIIRKSTMLVIVAIISTWIYILGEAYILRELGFYLPFDCVINSICIACLFQFGDDFYSVTLAKLECCCLCFCNCFCLNQLKHDDDQKQCNINDTLSFTSASSPNAINIKTDQQRNAIQYHAKIHSHHKLNQSHDQDQDQDQEPPQTSAKTQIQTDINNNNHNQILHSSLETLTCTDPTRINVGTPTQRYTGSPEQHILFSGPSSITEFIPLNLKESDSPHDVHINQNENNEHTIQFSETADSALTDSTSRYMTPLKPANRTGAIPVISKYKKPSKIV